MTTKETLQIHFCPWAIHCVNVGFTYCEERERVSIQMGRDCVEERERERERERRLSE